MLSHLRHHGGGTLPTVDDPDADGDGEPTRPECAARPDDFPHSDCNVSAGGTSPISTAGDRAAASPDPGIEIVVSDADRPVVTVGVSVVVGEGSVT